MEERKQITAFGKAIKHRLIDIEKPATWSIEEVGKKTGLYFDSSYLYKIQSGQLNTPKVVMAIREILELDESK